MLICTRAGWIVELHACPPRHAPFPNLLQSAPRFHAKSDKHELTRPRSQTGPDVPAARGSMSTGQIFFIYFQFTQHAAGIALGQGAAGKQAGKASAKPRLDREAETGLEHPRLVLLGNAGSSCCKVLCASASRIARTPHKGTTQSECCRLFLQFALTGHFRLPDRSRVKDSRKPCDVRE